MRYGLQTRRPSTRSFRAIHGLLSGRVRFASDLISRPSRRSQVAARCAGYRAAIGAAGERTKAFCQLALVLASLAAISWLWHSSDAIKPVIVSAAIPFGWARPREPAVDERAFGSFIPDHQLVVLMSPHIGLRFIEEQQHEVGA